MANQTKYTSTTSGSSSSNGGLEPRVAKLETGLEILTRDVTTLASVVREQGSNIEHEIQKLAVGVTQAAGPRKTDWSTIISALLLIMAIGSAVFWPLNQTSQNNKSDIQQLSQEFKNHQQLDNHPVGTALLSRIQGQIDAEVKALREADTAQNAFWSKQYSQHEEYDNREFRYLDERLQREFQLANKVLEQRLNYLEANNTERNKADLDELRAWRTKAMGLTSGK